jgi:hypothetical protein
MIPFQFPLDIRKDDMLLHLERSQTINATVTCCFEKTFKRSDFHQGDNPSQKPPDSLTVWATFFEHVSH